MPSTDTKALRIGEWLVTPATGELKRGPEVVRPEARTMRVLLALAERPGEVVSIDDLLTKVWPDVSVSSDSVYQAVASLRKLLGDDPKQPTYIATVPRLGYQMIARVEPWTEPASTPSPTNQRSLSAWAWLAAVLVIAALAGWLFLRERGTHKAPVLAAQTQHSVAVLPLQDLTDGMSNEEFADGMTEELINQLSRLPGMHVPSATSSFYYKNKQVPVGDIAKSLGVVYVVDGSVRKSGDRVRISTRLVRAENGYVIWTENYDRPFGDRLKVQDEIAGEVSKALQHSIDPR